MEKQGRVLILGAGLLQRPAIMAGRRLGYEVCVIDANEHAACVPLADTFRRIDLKDRESIAAYAAELQQTGGLQGVFTAGTDFSASAAYAAQRCSLPSHSFEAAVRASDKLRMRRAFASGGVPSPVFWEVQPGEAERFADEADGIRFPLVVKPADSMGARGCRLVRTRQELAAAAADAAAYSRSGRVIVEEYMAGSEFSLDALVSDGTVTICGFADRHIMYPPYFIEMGHTMPSACGSAVRLKVIEAFVRGIRALGLTCGAAKGDMKYTEKGAMVGEIAARLSGGYMSGWTYPYAADFDLTEAALCIACGRTPEKLLARRRRVSGLGADMDDSVYEIPCFCTCAERAWISIPGTVSRVTGIEAASGIEGVSDVIARTDEGSAVDFPRNNVEKCGNVIASSNFRKTAEERAEQAVSGIVVRLCAGNEKTDAFLQRRGEYGGLEFPPDAYRKPDGRPFVFNTACLKAVPRQGSISAVLPDEFAPYLDTLYDWNHRSLRQTLALFDELCPVRAELSAAELWNACARGGIQGMLYIADGGMCV